MRECLGRRFFVCRPSVVSPCLALTILLASFMLGCGGGSGSGTNGSNGSNSIKTMSSANLFSDGFEADNLIADGWSECGVAGCTNDLSTYVTPPNPESLSLGNYSQEFIEPNLSKYNVLAHTLANTLTSGTLYGRFYMYLGSQCSGSSFWVAAIISDNPPNSATNGYDTSVFISTTSDNQLELADIAAPPSYPSVHTTVSGGLAMAHWYRVEYAIPVTTTPSATVEMQVFDGDSTTPLSGGHIALNNMITVYSGGTGEKELDIGASNVQSLCTAGSAASVTMDNVALGTTGWIGPQ
jgi:hypothetical protein